MENILLEDIIEKIATDFIKTINKYNYSIVESNEKKLLLQSSFNKSTIIFEKTGDDILVNFTNKRGEKYLLSNWYLGTVNGICTRDVFEVLDNNEFINFVDDIIIHKGDEPKLIENQEKEASNNLTTTQKDITYLCNKISEILVYKNKQYGNSIFEPSGIFYKGDAINSILMRLDDKISRIKNSKDLRNNDIIDLIGYCILLLLARDVKISELDKLKD